MRQPLDSVLPDLSDDTETATDFLPTRMLF